MTFFYIYNIKLSNNNVTSYLKNIYIYIILGFMIIHDGYHHDGYSSYQLIAIHSHIYSNVIMSLQKSKTKLINGDMMIKNGLY